MEGDLGGGYLGNQGQYYKTFSAPHLTAQWIVQRFCLMLLMHLGYEFKLGYKFAIFIFNEFVLVAMISSGQMYSIKYS